MVLKAIFITLVSVALLLVLMGQLGMFKSKPPNNLGVTDGKLKRPSFTPNSVSSQAELWPDHPQRSYAHIAPLAVAGDANTAIERVKAVVQAMPGAHIVEQRGDYLYAQFTTKLMKYVDDCEFWYDPAARVVHVRSSSRVGRKDLGVNRARIEAIRAKLG